MKKIISIPDIKCEGCMTRVENWLRGVDGIDEIIGNFDHKEVLVIYDEDMIKIKDIGDIIISAGYTPGKVRDYDV
jgi:copper chaperone CopZ